ncbi:MAG TPA: hypothetical protein VLK58_18885 [Conexibacter sp.]|nr:hypothetical protein [Conexibacter sp.]
MSRAVAILERLPAWATTGVGSLPHDDPAQAAAHCLAAYELPFCPQLPRIEGDMVREWLGADPARCGWSRERDRERPRAWDALLAQLDAAPPAHRLVKLQVTGPATLACALERAGGAAARGASGATGGAPRTPSLALARELSAWLAANVAGQVRELAARDLDTLLVVDEPALPQFGGAAEEVAAVWDPLRVVAPVWGLHLCCAVPWETVAAACPDLISFDLALGPLDVRGADELGALLARGGRVAWGVLAAHRAEHAADATRRLRAALAQVGGEEAGRRSLLSASCGSGCVTVAREAEVALALLDTARALASPV